MAQPRPNYAYDQINRTGINAILLGAPGSGKGTQVRWTSFIDFHRGNINLIMIAQRMKEKRERIFYKLEVNVYHNQC